MPKPPIQNPRRAYVLIVIASACFAAMFTTVKLVPERIGSAEVMFVRGWIGMAGAGLFLLVSRERFRPGPLVTNLVRSGCGTASVLCQFYAVHEAGAELATANLLTQSAPLWVLLLSVPLLGERAPQRTKWALFAGLAGTALALGPTGAGERTGLLLALASGAFSALALLSVRKLVATENVPSVVLFFMGFAVLASAPVAVPALIAHGAWSARELGSVVAVGMLGTAGQLVMTMAYRYGTAAAVSIAGLSQVAFTACFAFTFIGGPAPAPGPIAGGILVLGAGLFSLQPWRAARVPDAAP